jgi:hypothetical protein
MKQFKIAIRLLTPSQASTLFPCSITPAIQPGLALADWQPGFIVLGVLHGVLLSKTRAIPESDDVWSVWTGGEWQPLLAVNAQLLTRLRTLPVRWLR